MIPNPALYDQDYASLSNLLLPPSKRLPKFQNWISCLLNALQWDHDLTFNTYANGDTSGDWVSGTNYTYLQTVRYLDNAIYECENPNGILSSTIPPNIDTANWIMRQGSFIGARERARYNGNKLMLEYAMNRYYRIFSPTVVYEQWDDVATPVSVPQIFILNSNNSFSNFWLSNGGTNALTSYLSSNSRFQRNFLGNSYSSFSPEAFTIYVPLGVLYYFLGLGGALIVGGLKILSGGTGYTSGSLTFTGGQEIGGTPATGTYTATGGVITGVTLTSGGTQYISTPTITASGGTGAVIIANFLIFNPNFINGIIAYAQNYVQAGKLFNVLIY